MADRQTLSTPTRFVGGGVMARWCRCGCGVLPVSDWVSIDAEEDIWSLFGSHEYELFIFLWRLQLIVCVSVRLPSQWAERLVAGGASEQWGEKWEERFKDGAGGKTVSLQTDRNT
jgi:hypothetical protein